MISHSLFVHVGTHLPGDDVTRIQFAAQLVGHLNIMLAETGRTFTLAGVDQAPIPPPEPNPFTLPNDCDVHLYLFSPHLTRQGSLSVGGDGRLLIFVPLEWLWLVDRDDFNLDRYSVLLATFIHELSHGFGCRGEGYLTLSCDPPEGIPLPRVNVWNYPNDPYWTASRRLQLLDPFFISHGVGHPLWKDEKQDLAWVLANVRPCPGNAAIIRGAYRKGAPWLRTIPVQAPAGARVMGWSAPGEFREPWFPALSAVADGVTHLAWTNREHMYPLMGIRVDHEGRVARGYIAIWELSWLAIAGIAPVIRADLATGTISLPPIPVRPPWEFDPRWRGGTWIVRLQLMVAWLRASRR